MRGIQNFLFFINENYVTILVCIGLILSIYKKVSSFLSKSDEEKFKIAKKLISETILKVVSDAESDYEDWRSSGSLKRAQVIDELYGTYPILAKVKEQDEIIKWIDEQIDNSLVCIRDILSKNGVRG